MNAILDFVRAAFPWVLAGVAVAVLCVRHSKQQNREEPRQDYSAEGMCLGMCLGVTMATTFGGMENLGLGLSLGMLVGMAIGACLEKPHKRANCAAFRRIDPMGRDEA